MNVLVVDCFNSSREQRQMSEDFVTLVRKAFTASAADQDPTIEVRGYKESMLQDLMWVQKGDWGIDPKILDTARVIFRESDADDSGSLDEGELFAVIFTLVNRLGMEADANFLEWMKVQVAASMAAFDEDLSGTIEEEELVEMLQADPWRSLFPEDTRKKEAAIAAMKKFCYLDVIIIDGDPNIVPWAKDMEDLLQLVWQVYYAQGWPGGGADCISMLGSAVLAQMTCYLASMGPQCILPLGGNLNGFPNAKTMPQWDTSSEAVKNGQVHLDNSTGNCYRYSQEAQAWEKAGNICMQLNATCQRPQRYRPKVPGQMENADTTRVMKESKALQHWCFEGIAQNVFPAVCDRIWDIYLPKTLTDQGEVKLLASSVRGPEIIEVRKASLVVMWPFMKQYKETVTVLNNFANHFKEVFAHHHSREKKFEWNDWLVFQANQNKMEVALPDRKVKGGIPPNRTPAGNDFDTNGRRTQRLGSPVSRPRTVPRALLRSPSPDPLIVFDHEPDIGAFRSSPKAKRRRTPSYMQRPLSPKSKTPVNPKSVQYIKDKYFAAGDPSQAQAMAEAFGSGQSTRSLAEECFFAPASELDYTRSQFAKTKAQFTKQTRRGVSRGGAQSVLSTMSGTGLLQVVKDAARTNGAGCRPQTTMAVYRPSFAEDERVTPCGKVPPQRTPPAAEATKPSKNTGSTFGSFGLEEEPEPNPPNFSAMPQRFPVARLGVNDCAGYRRLPPAEYEQVSTKLLPTKYEECTKSFKVKDQSPRKHKSYSSYTPDLKVGHRSGVPRRPRYVHGGEEASWRQSYLHRRRAAKHGEFDLSSPKEGEYFGDMATEHFLDPTSPTIGEGDAFAYAGAHFERTLKPTDTTKWGGSPVGRSQRPSDFHRSISPLKPRDTLNLLGGVILRNSQSDK